MKKKSPRGIPDFSSKGPKSLNSMPIDRNVKGPAARQLPDQPKVKPHSTSQKSGRRGA